MAQSPPSWTPPTGVCYSVDSSVYSDFLSSALRVPLYLEPWWIEASTGQLSSVNVWCNAPDAQSQIALPLWHPVEGHLAVPPHCQFWGPLYRHLSATNPNPEKTALLHQAVEVLKPFRSWHLHLLPDDQDVLPFLWQNAQAKPYFTHTIGLEKGIEAVRHNYHQLSQRKLRGFAQSDAQITEESPEAFLRLMPTKYRHRDIYPYWASLQRILHTALQNGSGRVLMAKTASGKARAAIFVVRHRDTCYYIAGWHSPESRCETVALLDASLSRAHADGATLFDFEGSMQMGIAQFFRSLGAEPCMYLRVQKGHLSLADRLKRKIYYRQHCI